MNTNRSIFRMLFIAGFLLLSGCKKDGGKGPLGCNADRESTAYQQAVEAYVADPSSVANCERLKQTATALLERVKNCTLANRKEIEEAIAQYKDIDCADQ